MAAIRNAMTFNRRPVQNITINRYVNVQQPTVKHNSGMGLAWAFFGLSAATSLFNGISGLFGSRQPSAAAPMATPQQPQNNTEFDNLKKVGKDFGYEVIMNNEGNYTAYKPGEGLPITGDYNTVLNMIMKTKQSEVDSDSDSDIDADTDTDPDNIELDGQSGLKEYGIDHDEGNTTLDIKKGYTWFNIVSAKYDIPSGVSAKDVALALAAANSGAEGTEAMDLARQGVYFKVGDLVNLPDTLNVNGQEISLKSDHQNQTVTPQDYGFAKATHWSAKVTQVGDKWYVTENGQRIGNAYDNEADALAAKNALIAQQNEE